ncbi:MAG: MFS transporter [Spirochaetaceae bacterium]|nr:MAG: MFS transporter [Spirochaetaceae bacterium]
MSPKKTDSRSESYDQTGQRVALTAAIMASFLTPFMVSSVNVALPVVGNEFSLNATALGWIATAYLLAAAMVLMPAGKLADIVGRKKLYLVGLGLYSGASFLCSFAVSSLSLILFRIFQGFGAGVMFATGLAIVTSVFPPEKRGMALGIVAGATYLGLSVGPVVGGLLTHYLGWQSIFWSTAPVGLIAFALVLFGLKGEWAEARGESFDLAGSIVLAISLPAVVYGSSNLPSLMGILLLAVGFLGICAFFLIEARISSPIFPVTLLGNNRTFAFSCLAALINYSSTFAVTFLLSLYLQHIQGLPPQRAGTVLVAQPIVMAAVSPLAGKLSDRIEVRVLASIGMALVALGLALLVFLDIQTRIPFVVVSLVVLGLGYGLFSSPNMNAIMSSVDKRLYGVASATVGTVRLMGQMLSMSIAVVIFTLVIGQVQISPAVYRQLLRSIRIAFSVFSLLCFAGIFASMVRGRLHSTRHQEA